MTWFSKNKTVIGMCIMMLLTVALFISDLVLGSVSIPFAEVCNILFGGDTERASWEVIVMNSRLPKALMAILSGIALSVSGLQMQTLFRNPLAGPYILGISSGAGLGVAILTMGLHLLPVSVGATIGNGSVILFSVLGSMGVLLILFWASLKVKDIMTILIFGVMLGAIITAIISLLQYFGSESQLKSFVIWTFGSLDGVTLSQVKLLYPIVIICVLMVYFQSKSLNILLLGENYAGTMGVSIKKSRFLIILTTGIMAGSITAFCGPIGFVGIVVPHICRLLFNTSDHRILIPASGLLGGVIILLSDIVSHLPGTDYILPINSITAVIGIPIIVWMIFSKRVISSSF